MDAKRQLGLRIRTLRTEKGLSQEQIAERIDRSVDAVSKIERGLSLPSLETLMRLTGPLGVSLADLVQPLEQPVGGPERAKLDALLVQLARSLDDRSLRIAVEQVKALAQGSRC